MQDSNAMLYNYEMLNIYQILNTILSPSTQTATVTNNYTVLDNDSVVWVDTLAALGDVTITLPDSGSFNGRLLIIKDITGDAATNNIIVTPASGLIEGAATDTLDVNDESIIYYCDGTNWYRVAWYSLVVDGGTP